MSVTVVVRPVWRSFHPKFLPNAVAHVRSGGFSVLLFDNGKRKLLLPRGRDGKLTDPALWALLALDVRRWGTARSGPAKGLASVRVRPIDEGIVEEWCDRDARHPRSTARVRLDCLACGACCRDNRVVLEPWDLAAFRRAGRPDLLSRDYVRTSKGKVVLKLDARKRCLHLAPKNLCRIYELRPYNCSVFPVGSEACLAARKDTLGIVD